MYRRLTCTLVVAVALGACGGSDSKPASSGGPTTPASSAAVPTTPTPAGKPATGAAFKPVDACSLLDTADVAPLVPDPKAEGHENPTPVGTEYVCRWDSQSGIVDWIDLTVAKAPPVSLTMVKQSFAVEAADHNGRVIDDLGDAALVQSVIPASAEVKVVRGPYYLGLHLGAFGARDHQDEVLSLARKAVAHLPS